MHEAVTRLHFPAQEAMLAAVPFLAEIRAFLKVALETRVVVGDRGAIEFVPFVGARNILERAVLAGDRGQRHPDRQDIGAAQRPERQVVVPVRPLRRLRLLDENLIVEQRHLVEPHQASRNLRTR
jgi:hypothetical protein